DEPLEKPFWRPAGDGQQLQAGLTACDGPTALFAGRPFRNRDLPPAELPARDPPQRRRDNQAPRDGRSRLLVQGVTDQARDRGPVSSWPGGLRPFPWEGGRGGIQRVAEPAAGDRVRGGDPQVPPLRGATFRSEDDAGRGAGRYLPLLRERLPPGHPPGAGPTHRTPGGRPMTPGGVVLQPPAG